eukprot:SAG11_NODE_3938_length_2142_cov_1.162017_2_plen_436_part_00
MGRGGKGRAPEWEEDTVLQPQELLLEGKLYDVTGILHKHPGGSVIKLYAGKGIDATQAFQSFHLRSTKARRWLYSLTARPAPRCDLQERLPGQTALLADFARLHSALQAEGMFEPAPFHIALRLLELAVLHAVGLWLLLSASPGLLFPSHMAKVIGVVLLGIGSGRCGWLMHEGGHYSLTGDIQIDRWLQVVLYGFGCGMSAGWWRSQHNRHHAMPQKEGADPDLNTLPLVAFTTKVAKRIGVSTRSWLRAQAPLFPLATCLLVALGWQLYLHPRFIIRKSSWHEAAVILLRYATWHVVITGSLGSLGSSTVAYLAYNWVAANYIFTNFAVSHTHLPTVASHDTEVDWVRYAALHTMDVGAGPCRCVDWWMCYLNYQIEHHLFPSMPQFRHPLVAPRVRQLFQRHGLPYDCRSYGSAMWATFANLDQVGSDLFLG